MDYRGAFVEPTDVILGIKGYQDTVDLKSPDICLYEAGKFIKLLMQCNPNVIELLFLPENSYSSLTWEGKMLIDQRQAFLSQRAFHTYGGYAVDQVNRLMKRGGESFSPQTKNRYSKHARHCFRLLNQGRQLLETGTLTVKVDNREELFAIGQLTPVELEVRFNQEWEKYNQIVPVLPQKPNIETINNLILEIRRHNWHG